MYPPCSRVSATTITFDFIGPVDNGGLPIEAFAVQYKMVGQEWSEKPLQRVWPVGAHNRYDLHDSEADVAGLFVPVLAPMHFFLLFHFQFAALLIIFFFL